MSEREDVREELEKKDAEMFRQQERARDSNDRLHGYDKTDADSFPASDPPSPMTSVTPGDDSKTKRQ